MSPSTTCPARSSTRTTICASSCATTASRKCTWCPQELLQPGRSVPRFPALPGRERLLRRGRRGGPGRRAGGEPAQPIGPGLRGPHARRPLVSHPPPARRGRRRRHGNDRHHRAKAGERDLLDATRRTEEANRLITEKNRALEGLYQRNPGQEPTSGGAGGADRRMEREARNARRRAGDADRPDGEADAVSLAQGQRPDHGRRRRRSAQDAAHARSRWSSSTCADSPGSPRPPSRRR